MAWRSYIAPPDDPNGNAGKLIWTDDQGHFQVGGTNPEGPASPAPVTGGLGPSAPATGSPTGSVGASEAQYALNAWIAAQTAKNNADRLNLLDIPAWQKKAAIDDADLKLRQAQEARASLNDEARRALDQQTLAISVGQLTGRYNGGATLAAQQTSGYMSTPGLESGAGSRIIGAADQLRANPAYQELQRRAADGDPQALTQKRQMEIAAIASATGLSMERAGALSNQFEARRNALGGQLMGAEDIDRLIGNDPSFQTPTLEREKEQNANAVSVLTLQSQLRGPDNAFAYARTLQGVPDSIRQSIGRFATNAGVAGYAGQNDLGPASVGGLVRDATATPGYGVSGPGRTSYSQAGIAAGDPAIGAQYAAAVPRYGVTMSGVDPRVSAPVTNYGMGRTLEGQRVDQGATTGGIDPRPPEMGGQGQMGPGTMNYQRQATGQPVNVAANVPRYGAPQHLYQLSPQDWNRTNVYGQKLYLAGQEAIGRDKEAELDMYRKSLPKYGGAARGRIAA